MGKWDDIAFKPDDELSRFAWEAWRWLVDEPWDLILCSKFGGLFFEKTLSGGVFWLEAGTGLIERVADTPAQFHDFLGGGDSGAWRDRVDEWFLVPFVYQLHAAGKKPKFGECFGVKILPVFEGGSYSEENVFVLPSSDWIRFTGGMHRWLSELPDDAQEVKIEGAAGEVVYRTLVGQPARLALTERVNSALRSATGRWRDRSLRLGRRLLRKS